MKKDILNFVSKCGTCQCNKGELIKPPNTLHPLPIISSIWTNIFMDFITYFPKEGNKLVIMVVVEKLSKFPFLFLDAPFLIGYGHTNFHGLYF